MIREDLSRLNFKQLYCDYCKRGEFVQEKFVHHVEREKLIFEKWANGEINTEDCFVALDERYHLLEDYHIRNYDENAFIEWLAWLGYRR